MADYAIANPPCGLCSVERKGKLEARLGFEPSLRTLHSPRVSAPPPGRHHLYHSDDRYQSRIDLNVIITAARKNRAISNIFTCSFPKAARRGCCAGFPPPPERPRSPAASQPRGLDFRIESAEGQGGCPPDRAPRSDASACGLRRQRRDEKRWLFEPGANSWPSPGRRRCRTKCCGRCIVPPSTSIRGRCWRSPTACLSDLRRLFSTNGRCYIYIANGHGAWEAALTNVLSRGRQGAGARKRPVCAQLGRSRRKARRRDGGPARAIGAVRCGRPKSRSACGRTRPARSRRSSSPISTPPPASSTTSPRSARRSRRRATTPS